MKTLKNVLPKAAIIFLIFTLLCGVVYTGVVTGMASHIFPDKANGSIIEIDGKSMVVSCWGSNTPMKPICGDGL